MFFSLFSEMYGFSQNFSFFTKLYVTAKCFSVPTNISRMKQYCCEQHTKSQQLFFKPFA